MSMKKYIIITITILIIVVTGIMIANNILLFKNTGSIEGGEKETLHYKSISMDEAKEIFCEPGNYIIVDVRREDEFSEGHIPGAINIPNETIESEPAALPDKSQVIYVYCRSGNRSKQAAQKLVELGYTSVIEFGGILDWTGDIER